MNRVDCNFHMCVNNVSLAPSVPHFKFRYIYFHLCIFSTLFSLFSAVLHKKTLTLCFYAKLPQKSRHVDGVNRRISENPINHYALKTASTKPMTKVRWAKVLQIAVRNFDIENFELQLK